MKEFKYIATTKNFLKSDELPKRYDLVISTMPNQYKSNFIVDWDKNKNVTLLINKNVDDLKEILSFNKKVRTITFKNWDSRNIKYLTSAFEGMNLDIFPDFSKQDFSNLLSLYGAFSLTDTEDDIVFKNKTLKKLKNIDYMFYNTKCKKINVDLHKTSIDTMNATCQNTLCNDFTLIIDETDNNVSCENFFLLSTIKDVNLSKLNFSKVEDFTSFIRGCEIDRLYMPNSIPVSTDIGHISLNIKKIYCNKKWAEILED